MATRIWSSLDIQEVLTGTVVRVEATSPNGDFVLHYADGKRVDIDCGYVGVTVYVTAVGGAQERVSEVAQ